MTTERRSRGKRRGAPRPTRVAPVDIWRSSPPLPDIEPVTANPDVGALLRSLGDAPLRNGALAGHYFDAVVERAAAVASALALSIGLLVETGDD